MRTLFHLFLPILLVAAGSRTALTNEPVGHEVVELTLHPAAAPRPVMKHRLLPSYLDQSPGNAAMMYTKTILAMLDYPRELREMQDVREWLAIPLDQLPRDQVLEKLSHFDEQILSDIELASHREYCVWEYAIRESPNPLAIILPEVQESLNVGRLLALRARFEMAEGQLHKALRTLRVGFALARDLGKQPFLVSGVAGQVIERTMISQLLDFVQAADAPNLYWSLTALAPDVVDLRHGYDLEEAVFYLLFPELRDLGAQQRTDEQWNTLAYEVLQKAINISTLASGADYKWLKALKPEMLVETGHPLARLRLIERGYEATHVEAMPSGRVALIDFVETYSEMFDSQWKLLHMPFWEAEAEFNKAKGQEKPLDELTSAVRLAVAYQPDLYQVARSRADIRRKLGALRIIEAIRLYAASHDGQLPQSLGQAEVPIPEDAMTGQAFPYRLERNVGVLEETAPDGAVERQYRLRIAQ